MRKLLLTVAALLAVLALGEAVVGAFQDFNARIAASRIRA